MPAHELRRLFLPPAVLLFACLPLTALSTPDSSDQPTRQQVLALFTEGKRLDALPYLEDLAQKNPQDSDVLVALAASLVEHAATLGDANQAAQERFRARDLLQKAWRLGNTSPLAENLRQLLQELPANGAIEFSADPAVGQAMNAGEAAFARRDFAAALKNYAAALQLEPTNYSAVLFTANTYDKKNDFTRAAEWYERAAHMDPNIETAYRYYADMLARRGNMAKARSLLIQAAVAEPYNRIVWREIRAWAFINKTAFNLVYVGIPLPPQDTHSAQGPAALSPAWQAYYAVKSDWKKGGRFARQFPREAQYRHSLAEESEALRAAAQVLQKLNRDTRTVKVVTDNPTADLLLKLYESGLMDPYVLFSLGDEGIAKDYLAYRAGNRDKLETYMDKFVMPHVTH